MDLFLFVALLIVFPGRLSWGKGSLSITPWWLPVGEYLLGKVMTAKKSDAGGGDYPMPTKIIRRNEHLEEEAIVERSPEHCNGEEVKRVVMPE